MRKILRSTYILLFLLLLSSTLTAQVIQETETELNFKGSIKSVSPRSAFLRSMVLPGWGHHYLGRDHKRRARVHFTSELLFIASYFGLNQRASNMENRMFSYANTQIGIDLSQKSRAFQLAVAQYNSLNEYNDFMERSRNWDQILPNTPENQWNWSNDISRERYVKLRDDRERANQQLPGILSLMVVNRLFSGLNAFTVARNMTALPSLSVKSVDAKSAFMIVAQFDF